VQDPGALDMGAWDIKSLRQGSLVTQEPYETPTSNTSYLYGGIMVQAVASFVFAQEP